MFSRFGLLFLRWLLLGGLAMQVPLSRTPYRFVLLSLRPAREVGQARLEHQELASRARREDAFKEHHLRLVLFEVAQAEARPSLRVRERQIPVPLPRIPYRFVQPVRSSSASSTSNPHCSTP